MVHDAGSSLRLAALSLLLTACGASLARPPSGDGGTPTDAPSPPPDAPDASSPPPDAPDAPDAPSPPPDAPDAPARCELAGRWSGWWSYGEPGHGESRSAIRMRFTGAVTGVGERPSGALTRGSLSRSGEVRFTVGESGSSVGFAFNGSLTGCDAMSGSYATHSFGGRFGLYRERCEAPTRSLTLDGRGGSGDLDGAPVAMISECQREVPSASEAYTLRVARRGYVAVWLEGEAPSPSGLAVSLRASCDAPSVTCAPPGTSIRALLEPGDHRVVVSAATPQGARYTLRAASVEEGPESRCETAPEVRPRVPVTLRGGRSLGADSYCGAVSDAVYARVIVPRGTRMTVTAWGEGLTLGAREGCAEFCDARGVGLRDGSTAITLDGAPDRDRELTLSVGVPRGGDALLVAEPVVE
ncbi:MAG: hypothetical protein R3A48_22195 [Polyangiales bacterium]